MSNKFVKKEEEILKFWDKNKTFEKSVEKEAPNGDYVFYDGPPFGTGEPHYGHLLSSICKDVVPRYWTMRGYRVERRWGWDCHGLPIENIIEKEIGISGKKQIEEVGIAKFNEACRKRVLEYADIWDKMIRRIARWVEFKNSYKTMDLDFMESVWWGFSELWKKDLVYQGRKVLLYCPRCETPISNFEVAMDNSYKEITETSVYAKFKVKQPEKLRAELAGQNVYILAWTTTPWTLPGNVALAVGEEISYVVMQDGDNKYILAKKIYEKWKNEKKLEIGNWKLEIELKGKDLVSLEYEPLFDAPALRESGKKVYYVAAADFVTTEDGTGVVHTAVVYGEDDYNLGLKLDLPVIPALNEKGYFNETVPQYKGIYFKYADKMIIEDLEKRGLLFEKLPFKHSYPFCWRCDTQLFYNAIPAWFVAIKKLKKRMVELNENINWFPEHLKCGRFAQGIEQAPDWNISRNRYFATPIPIWECAECGEKEVIDSVSKLKEKSGKDDITDIHSHYIDKLEWKCSKCSGQMRRIKEVFDCWVESGSMSFAQMHYPFENKERFEKNFPAQFIVEYISQTRAWFYVMHVLSTAIFNSNSFENVLTTGVILNEKGEKMSKSKKNFPDPWKVINEFGADALRFYLMSSTVMHADNLFFNERDLRDVFRKNIMLIDNVLKFYEMFEDKSKIKSQKSKVDSESKNILDKWIFARLKQLIENITEYMNSYDLVKSSRLITEFIDDLSTWYLRRSRDRFKGSGSVQSNINTPLSPLEGGTKEESFAINDKTTALQTTRYVLTELSKIMAPFMPFVAEDIWQKVAGFNYEDGNKSVHLEEWPKSELRIKNQELRIIEDMAKTRKVVEIGMALRAEANIKVRQALSKLEIKGAELEEDYLTLIRDELNVKGVAIVENIAGGGGVKVMSEGEIAVGLHTELTPELIQEGIARELVRQINAIRKNKGLTIKDRVKVYYKTQSDAVNKALSEMESHIKEGTLADEIISGDVEGGEEVKMNGEIVRLRVEKFPPEADQPLAEEI